MAIPIIPRDPVPPDKEEEFIKFICPPTFNGPTPDAVVPDITFTRRLQDNLDVTMWDGRKVRMWVISDPSLPATFPSPLMRVREGQVVHTIANVSGNTHTIHHHGIDPTPMNDGVGKMSFELTSSYRYQWYASHAGTYTYHCHKNTVLHFEMGMYGLLIIDPPTGPGTAFTGGPAYDVEAFWVSDEIDSRWHEFSHNAFMAGCNVNGPFTNDGILHDFQPDYFLMNGLSIAPNAPVNDARVAITIKAGQTILLRLTNAGYTLNRWTIGLPVTVVAMDGRPLGGTPETKYSSPFKLRANYPFLLSTAQRWDLIIKPPPSPFPKSYLATLQYRHWITGKVLGTVQTFINVT